MVTEKRKLRCILTIHKWKLSRPLVAMDSFPPLGAKWDLPTRSCAFCGVTQKWLPGYGGSEIGCWYYG